MTKMKTRREESEDENDQNDNSQNDSDQNTSEESHHKNKKHKEKPDKKPDKKSDKKADKKSDKKTKEKNDNDPTEKVTDRMKSVFLKFTEYDDLIKEKQKELRDLKVKKDECEEFILEHWDEMGDVDVIEVKGSKVARDRRESKGPVKPEMVKDTLEKELNDINQVKKLMSKMDDKREVKEKVSLKRTVPVCKRVVKKKKNDDDDEE